MPIIFPTLYLYYLQSKSLPHFSSSLVTICLRNRSQRILEGLNEKKKLSDIEMATNIILLSSNSAKASFNGTKPKLITIYQLTR